METLSTMVHMGGYAGYVWPAYGISVVVLAAVLVASMSAARRNEAELEQLQLTRRARRGAAAAKEDAGGEAAPVDATMLESP